MAAWDDEDEAQRDAAVRRNQARTDVRNFLTQRAIQSFMFLLHSCRDPHTVRWLEHTYGFTNLLEYHGSGAFNLTIYPEWDSILQDMTFYLFTLSHSQSIDACFPEILACADTAYETTRVVPGLHADRLWPEVSVRHSSRPCPVPSYKHPL